MTAKPSPPSHHREAITAKLSMPPLRILEYITSVSKGGAEHGVQIESRELVRRGHCVTFLSPEGRWLTGALEEGGFRVWAPRTFGKVDPRMLLRLVHFLRAERIQLVHTHLSTASLLGSIAARICRIPSVATVHGLNNAFCYRLSTRVVAVSEAVRAHLIAQGLLAERIRVVHNGIELERYEGLPGKSEARRRLGLPGEGSLLVYAGRLAPEKGVLLLPALFQEVHQDIPEAHLMLVGDGVLRSELQQRFAESGVDARVHFMGFQDDPRLYLAAGDLLLLPSYREGLPRVLLEGMALGLPAVGTQAGGIPEAIEPGVTGAMAPVGDAEALARASIELLTDSQRLEAMGQAARAACRRRFSAVRSVSRLENVFAEVLGLAAVPDPNEALYG